MKKKKSGHIASAVIYFLFVIVCLLLFSIIWAKKNYGNIGMEEIVFHLNMPLQGTADNLIFGYVEAAVFPTVMIALCLLAWIFWPVRYVYSVWIKIKEKTVRIQIFPLRFHIKWCFLLIAVMFSAVLYVANQSFALAEFISNQIHRSTFIEEEYVSASDVQIQFPAKKRNLISIYIESGETSAQDKKNGGLFDENRIPEMTQIAKDNISFSHSELLEGAAVAPACGWTIAGLVAETAGLPLKLYGFTDDDTGKKVDNTMRKYEYFLPGVVSLGDILKENGYRTYFMAGSDFKFGGRYNYFSQHGDYEVWDLKTARQLGKIPKDYKVRWGFEDEKLYTYAREQLLEIAKSDEPFHFSMLTVDTHNPDGYLCRLCPDKFDDRYSNVWACASAQLNDFIEWLKQQDFYDNTTIVILGDHCSMVKDFYKGDYTYDKHGGQTERKVYNAIINSAVTPVHMKNRQFTTMDFFPTTLASIGATIEGDRLGLGVNLFSDKKTLAEEYGYEYMFDELSKKSTFYNEKLLYP